MADSSSTVGKPIGGHAGKNKICIMGNLLIAEIQILVQGRLEGWPLMLYHRKMVTIRNDHE